MGLSSFDAVVCITEGARIVDVEFEHDGVYHLPYPVVVGPGCDEYGQYWSGNMPNRAVASVKIKYDSGRVAVSMGSGNLFGGTWSLDSTPAVFSNGVVTIVPEPATLMLLALGTMLLRKKR
ncbi:MAG: PEP-CTERM sorting domain-containing protein [Phycisphaerae bacterium]|nr:PEP-CTERM sorting domain-containing protein [Phycisphaerae bacterium]